MRDGIYANPRDLVDFAFDEAVVRVFPDMQGDVVCVGLGIGTTTSAYGCVGCLQQLHALA